MRSPVGGRALAACLATSLVLHACSGSDSEPAAEPDGTTTVTTEPPPATTASPSTTTPPAVDPTAAFGAHRPVQDVILRFEMAVVDDDGERHVLGDVRDLARSGTGSAIQLGEGVALRPTGTIAGEVVDQDGQPVEGPRVDYALLSLDEDGVAAAATALEDEPEASVLVPEGPGDILVEIITADLALGHTHVSPGDRAVMDITAVDAVQPGDRIVQRYLFAQTLPGDPEEEADLDPFELFASRWAAGLVRVAGDDAGPAVFEDGTREALEGSTKVELEVKQALLAGARMRGEVEGFHESRVVLTQRGEQQIEDVGGVEGVGGGIVVLYDQPGEEPDDENVQGPTQREITTDEFGVLLATLRGRQACMALLPEMLLQNRLATRLDDVGDAISRTGVGDDLDLGGVDLSSDGEPSLDDVADLRIPRRLIDTCDPPPPPPDPPSLPFIPTGGTFGDIRLRTLDGLQYDHQATGEFLLFESPTTAVHIRTEPADGTDDVSVATATALRLTTASLSMHLDGSTYLDDQAIDLVRGEPTELDGVAVVDSGPGWGIVFGDGTQVRVDRFPNQLVTVVNAATLPTGGLLGDGNGDESDDLVSRDGTSVTVEEATGADRTRFYDTFVASWRLDDDESLLHHRPGESAEDFVIDGFPSTTVRIEDLEPQRRAAAASTCLSTGVRTADGLRDCTLDVALTGDESFAFATFVFEVASVPPIADTDTAPDAPQGAAGPGRLTVADTSIDLGPDPSRMPNTPFNRSCTADAGGFTLEQRHTVSATERYAVEIRYEPGPGDGRFTLTVERNGEQWAWVLDWIEPPPGEIDTLAVDEQGLRATGTVFVNEPFDPLLGPLAEVPADGRREPFSLDIGCD